MKEKNKKFIFIILLCILLFIIFIILIMPKIQSSLELFNLKEYSLQPEETIRKEFEYNNKKYVLTQYYKSNSSYAYNHILLKDDSTYYFLDEIEKCDMSDYIKENILFVHCIGKSGDILKYEIKSNKVEEEIIKFSYEDVPNISQIHITIKNVDDNYIYLNSLQDDFKCSFNTKKCE